MADRRVVPQWRMGVATAGLGFEVFFGHVEAFHGCEVAAPVPAVFTF
jgi:hypothetical protein